MTRHENLSAGPIEIESIRFDGNALLAPMAGITDAPFRRIAQKFGAAAVVSEMIASANLSTGQKELTRKLESAGNTPHIVQIAGNEKKWMVRGAELARDAGAHIIDVNMGCPSKKVTNGYAGSALMRVPDKALGLIEAVVRATRLPVTLKMRLGWNEESLNARQIARQAVEAGVQMITMHARTRQQFYKGRARWHLVQEVVDAVSVPVIVNGDIQDISSAMQALKRSGAAGVMIGRAARGRPWIVGEINRGLGGGAKFTAPQRTELVHLIEQHYADMLATYGPVLGVRIARKHLRWYLEAAGVSSGSNQCRELLTSTDPDQTMARTRQYLEQVPEENSKTIRSFSIPACEQVPVPC